MAYMEQFYHRLIELNGATHQCYKETAILRLGGTFQQGGVGEAQIPSWSTTLPPTPNFILLHGEPVLPSIMGLPLLPTSSGLKS